MKQTDVLIVGGSATGLVAALTAKSNYPDKKVMVIHKEENSYGASKFKSYISSVKP